MDQMLDQYFVMSTEKIHNQEIENCVLFIGLT